METPLILLATIAFLGGCEMIRVTPYDPVVVIAQRNSRNARTRCWQMAMQDVFPSRKASSFWNSPSVS